MKEGDQITAGELIENWEEILKFYDDLIDQGFKLRPIRFLVQYIIDQGYSKEIYGGTSFYNLLISLPKENKIDFTKSLQVKYNPLFQIVEFNYHNKPKEERTKENRDWSKDCQATEVVETFKQFLNDNEDWTKIEMHDSPTIPKAH